MRRAIGDRRHQAEDGHRKRGMSRDEARRLAMSINVAEGAQVNWYRCAICNRWHIGSRR